MSINQKRKRKTPKKTERTISLWNPKDYKLAWNKLEPYLETSNTWPNCIVPTVEVVKKWGTGVTCDKTKGYMRFNKQPYTDYHTHTPLHHLACAADDEWTGNFDVSHEQAISMMKQLDVSHLCHNNGCCNTEHLVLETNELNKSRNGCCSRLIFDPTLTFPLQELLENCDVVKWFKDNKDFVTCQHNPNCLTTPESLKEIKDRFNEYL